MMMYTTAACLVALLISPTVSQEGGSEGTPPIIGDILGVSVDELQGGGTVHITGAVLTALPDSSDLRVETFGTGSHAPVPLRRVSSARVCVEFKYGPDGHHPVLKSDDHAAQIVFNESKLISDDHAGYAESIFPQDPNHDAQGRPIPIQQNTCKDKAYPNVQYEQGQLFQVTSAGHATAVRFFAAALERGAHEARIWRMTDNQKLAEATIPASALNGTSRWIQHAISPVQLTVGVSYMVTVTTGTDQWHAWAGCPACWLPAGTNSHHITWPASSARFGTVVGSIPTRTPRYGESYLKDIVFCTGTGSDPCGPPAPPPVPAEIHIAGPSFVERPPNIAGMRRATYRAQGVDQSGKDLQPAFLRNLAWSVAGGAPAGVSLAKVSQTLPQSPCLAVLKVDGNLTADTILNLTASIPNSTTSAAILSMRITVALLKATAVTVTGPAAVNLNVTSAEMHSYKATVGGGDGDGGDGRRGRRRRRRAAAVAAAAAVVTLRGVEVRAGGPHQACVGVGPGAACVLRGCELGVVLVERGARCTLHRCTVRDSPTGGVLVDGGEASLLGSTVERCVEHGVLAVGGAQVTMGEGCVVRHCGSGVAAFGHGGHPGLEGAQPTGAATPPGPQTRVVLREVSVAHSRTFGLGATDGGAVRLTQHTMVSGSGEADYKVQNHGTIRLRRSATLEG
jgi:hypothetical protein